MEILLPRSSLTFHRSLRVVVTHSGEMSIVCAYDVESRAWDDGKDFHFAAPECDKKFNEGRC